MMDRKQAWEIAQRIELLSREPSPDMPAGRIAFPEGLPADDIRAILAWLRST